MGITSPPWPFDAPTPSGDQNACLGPTEGGAHHYIDYYLELVCCAAWDRLRPQTYTDFPSRISENGSNWIVCYVTDYIILVMQKKSQTIIQIEKQNMPLGILWENALSRLMKRISARHLLACASTQHYICISRPGVYGEALKAKPVQGHRQVGVSVRTVRMSPGCLHGELPLSKNTQRQSTSCMNVDKRSPKIQGNRQVRDYTGRFFFIFK